MIRRIRARSVLVLAWLVFSFSISLFCCGFEVSVADSSLYWLSGYGYRKAVNVRGESQVQFNYAIRVIVHYGNGTDSDNEIYLGKNVSKNFQDVRFTNGKGGFLKTQRGVWYPGDKAVFQVTLPLLPARPSNVTIYIYYDNPTVSWQKYESNPVFQNDPNKDWENDSVRDTSIVWNGSYYCMFYQGMKHPIAGDPDYETAIGFAVSEDGISWTRMNNGEPVLTKNTSNAWEATGVGIPDVLYENNIFHMWYSGRSSLDGKYRVGYANSTDGITWKRNLNNPILDVGKSWKFDYRSIYHHGTIHDDNGNYTMIYTGHRAGEMSGVATSSTPWDDFYKLNNGDPVMTYDELWERDEITCNDLVLVNGVYYTVYAGGHGSIQMQIGLAKSANLIDWIKDVNPVLENWAGTFDAEQLHDPNFLQMQDGKWRIYYSGTSEGGNYGNFDIGFAETDLTDHPLFLSDADANALFDILGDVDENGKVDLIDTQLLQLAMMTIPGYPGWNPKADIDGDRDVDVVDQRIQILQVFKSW